MRFGRPRDDEQSRGVAVEPVDDPRPLGLVTSFDVVGEQPVHEGAVGVPWSRMDDEACGLVDHEQVLVLVRDDEVHRLRHERRGRRGWRLEQELLSALELVALQPRAAVDEHAGHAEETLGDRA